MGDLPLERTDSAAALRLQRVRRLAEVLDDGFVDPVLGLVPGVGDTIGALVAGWILVEAARLGASRATLLRITGNIVLDATVGAIPVLGDIADFFLKSNLRNVALLERHLADPARARAADRGVVLALAGGVVLVGAGLAAGGAWLVALLLRTLF